MTRLNIGSHSKRIEGYENVDILELPDVDHVFDITQKWRFEDNSIEEILMVETLEHIGIHDTQFVLLECFRVLKERGRLIIQVPDCGSMMRMYVNDEVGEEVPHKPKSVEQVLEITKDTGKRVHPRRWVYAFTGAQKYGVPDIHKNFFTKERLEDCLLNAGFKVDFKDDPLGWKIKCVATK
jgi:predicted SAM-dependent methyltransferase